MNKGKLIFTAAIASLVMMVNVNSASAQSDVSHNMMHDGSTAMLSVNKPTLPGQDAFAAIQEIIGILEADPSTDWSRVNISALREHLVDMNQLIMNADVKEEDVSGGLIIHVSGSGRSLQAIQRMVPAHASVIDQLNGWTVRAELTQNGVRLMVTADNTKQAMHIKGLGFFGLMATGNHHQQHHLALARGEGVHSQ